jgi:DNA-binding HxlR family transcriptional regulator
VAKAQEESDRHTPALSPQGAARLRAVSTALNASPETLGATAEGAALATFIRRMDRHDNDRSAPVREVMARLGDRWSTLILLVLSAGTFRHATLRRLIAAMSAERAISQRMLTLRLRALERDGFVERLVTPTVPPRVDYRLTEMGREFMAMIDGLLAWIEARAGDIEASRAKFGE